MVAPVTPLWPSVQTDVFFLMEGDVILEKESSALICVCFSTIRQIEPFVGTVLSVFTHRWQQC